MALRNPRLSEGDDLLPFMVSIWIHRAAHYPSMRTFMTHEEAEKYARDMSNYYGVAAFLTQQSEDDPQEYDLVETYTPQEKSKRNPGRVRNPNRYRLQFWTGPAFVDQIAQAAVAAGYDVEQGTENIYLEAEGSDSQAAAHNFLVDLQRVHGTDYGLKLRSASHAMNPSKRSSVLARMRNPY